ncbi:hypothetical protein TSAR_010954 [Trichomalopsis sarcophagae]|uniref:Uncharacterized protein n=1 Tax=Trichomalopsis sarcophagae TaxID=543379 RepID=A0A232EH63_9HYME|nr:hypothetical protein TSAR_010954 [Trichomalopsis sarcophagae]
MHKTKPNYAILRGRKLIHLSNTTISSTNAFMGRREQVQVLDSVMPKRVNLIVQQQLHSRCLKMGSITLLGLTHTLPQNRKCDEETENFVKKSLKLGCVKQNIINAVAEKGKNRRILKDIHNIEQMLKKSLKSNDLAEVLAFLQKNGITKLEYFFYFIIYY